jgi:hypothetical protein
MGGGQNTWRAEAALEGVMFLEARSKRTKRVTLPAR